MNKDPNGIISLKVEFDQLIIYPLLSVEQKESFKHNSMKAFFVSSYAFFAITATITHIWTVIIAFSEGGFFGGVYTAPLKPDHFVE